MSATAAGTGDVRGIHEARVGDWLAKHVEGARAPFRFELIAGGHSNLTYRVTAADGELFVLRRPPLGAVLATAHDMGREHKIIAAIGARTDVPVAPALGLCTDVAVNDAPFYVMKFVAGHVITDATTVSRLFTPAQRHEIGESLVGVLARLHLVDPDAIGLGDLGRKEAYLPRQLNRWRTQWEKSKTRELPAMDEVHEALVALMPEQKYTGIVHGDYRLGNCITGAERAHRRGARLGALHARRCACRPRLPDEQLGRARRGRRQRRRSRLAVGRGRLPDPRRGARALLEPDRPPDHERRLLPRVPVLAPRRDRRGRDGPLPEGRDGRQRRHQRVSRRRSTAWPAPRSASCARSAAAESRPGRDQIASRDPPASNG